MPKVDLALAQTFFKTTNPHLSYKNIISKLYNPIFSSVSEKSKALEMAKKTLVSIAISKLIMNNNTFKYRQDINLIV